MRKIQAELREISEPLREWLRVHERPGSWLGRTLGVSRQAVHCWIIGEGRPAPHLREPLAMLTGISAHRWWTMQERREAQAALERIATVIR